MVDNKKKVLNSVVAAAALTGAFAVPATAQAAENMETPFDMMDGIQNAEAVQARQEARAKRDSAKNAAKPFHDLQGKKRNYDNKTNNYQQKLTKYNNGEISEGEFQTAENEYIEAEKSFKDKLNNLFVDKSENQELKDIRSSYNQALRDYGNKKKDRDRGTVDDSAVEVAKANLDRVKAEYNDMLEVAKDGTSNDDIYDSYMTEAEPLFTVERAAIQEYEAVVAQEWGNWTKEHQVRDRSEDTKFQEIIPEFQKLVQKERLAIAAERVSAQKLDPNQLFLENDHEVRVWFINEGAGYRNQLAYEATNGDSYDKGMIFDDVSCNENDALFGEDCQLGNKNGPLDIGDFVNLGLIEGGTQLNFLLRADGKNGANTRNGDIYGSNTSLNGDNLQHLMAFAVEAGSRDYLMLGFEDLRNGGDKDYNDTVFVVDFGEGNLNNLTGKPGKPKLAQAATVPEASNMAAILGVTGAGLMLRRRRQKGVNKFI